MDPLLNVCMHACMEVWISVCACACAGVYAFVTVHMYTYMYVHIQNPMFVPFPQSLQPTWPYSNGLPLPFLTT